MRIIGFFEKINIKILTCSIKQTLHVINTLTVNVDKTSMIFYALCLTAEIGFSIFIIYKYINQLKLKYKVCRWKFHYFCKSIHSKLKLTLKG